MDGTGHTIEDQSDLFAEYDRALAELDAAKDKWAQAPIGERISLLTRTKDTVLAASEEWVDAAACGKGLTPGTPLAGEEWLAGPFATLAGINTLLETLGKMDGKTYIDRLPTRVLPTGQTAVKVLPHSIWDHLLLSGVTAEVWMQDGINRENLKENSAIAYDQPESERMGKVALILGAGNVAAITTLDVLQKLILENQVVLLKMNPVNEDLTEHFQTALKPLIDAGYLRIVKGDAVGGAYLCDHPTVEELHITGSDKTHDAIVWGVGEEGERNRKAGKPKNTRRFTSELGSVSPTIVVPGPWSAADIRFQAENIATMKLHNAGHNCIGCQALIMPKGWDNGPALLDALGEVATQCKRPTWYPGVEKRMTEYEAHVSTAEKVSRGPDAPALIISDLAAEPYNRQNEVFGPALGVVELEAKDAETYLREAIEYANSELWGTLGANILIHPKTIRQIGKPRFEQIIADLRYGTIGINGWCGLGFLSTTCPWGAYPGHTPEDIQSGIGTVHNAFMLENTERTVVQAPWRPFPRGLLSFQFSMMPRPPFFITNKRQHKIGQALTEFQHKPSWAKLPRIFYQALMG